MSIEDCREQSASIAGDPVPASDLISQLYDELKRIARAKLASDRRGHTLSATALLHEAYLRLEPRVHGWSGKRGFFLAAAEAMQRVLVDYARRRNAAKRGGGAPCVHVDDDVVSRIRFDPAFDPEVLNENLEKLRLVDEEAHRIVILRFFAGLSSEDTADLLGLDRRTVGRRWRGARAWLLDHIRDAEADR
ncbi:MAG: sigma-70 family RNA polymerase sigma factor [Phycisphaerae bacterium]|nr:sigma-70 family RNA polymerase sigma factor [Phycisphaerae bacterium]